MSDEQHGPSRLQVASVVAFYMTAALVMVFVNKAVLNSSPDIPFAFITAQTLIAVILLRIASIFSPERFHLDPITWVELRTIFPLVFVGMIGLAFNTLCLRDVDATFFQIARGLLLPMTIIVSSVATRKTPRRNVLVAAVIVTCGFMVGVSPSSNFRSNALRNVADKGLMYGLLSSLITAIHAVMGKTQVTRQITIVQLAYNNNLIGSCLLMPFIMLNGEVPKLQNMLEFPGDGQLRVFLLGGAVTGLFGLFLSLAGLLSIKVTSPVTHMFSAAARSVLQTALGVWIFGDILTLHRVGSLSLISCGTLYFTWVQNAGPPRPPPPPQPTVDEKVRDLEKQ